jgi:hypothetical protein
MRRCLPLLFLFALAACGGGGDVDRVECSPDDWTAPQLVQCDACVADWHDCLDEAQKPDPRGACCKAGECWVVCAFICDARLGDCQRAIY